MVPLLVPCFGVNQSIIVCPLFFGVGELNPNIYTSKVVKMFAFSPSGDGGEGNRVKVLNVVIVFLIYGEKSAKNLRICLLISILHAMINWQ